MTINTWKKLIDQFEIDTKACEIEILKSEFSLADYNYLTVSSIIKNLFEKSDTVCKSVLKIFASKTKNPLFLSFLLESLYNGSAEIDDYLLKNHFLGMNLMIFHQLSAIGDHFGSKRFWSKVERYLDYFEFYKKINEFMAEGNEHVQMYFLEKLGSVKTARSQYMILPYIKDCDAKIIKKAIQSLKGFEDQTTVNAIIEIYDKDSSFEKEIFESLSGIAEKNCDMIKSLLTRSYEPFQKKLVLDILAKMDPLLILEELIDFFDTIDERLKIYLGKKIEQILKGILEKKMAIQDYEEKRVFMEQHRSIIERLINSIGIEEINFSVITRVLFEFEELYIDRISQIFEAMTEENKSSFVQSLIRLDRIDILNCISEKIRSFNDEKQLDRLLDYLKAKLNQGAIEILIRLMINLKAPYNDKIFEFLAEKNLISEYSKYVNDFNPVVRAGAIRLLKNTKNLVNYEKIMQRMKDPDKNVRIEVLNALFAINPSKAMEVLKDFIRDPEEEIVINAVNILRNYDSKESCYLFIDLLTHPSLKVKKIASFEVAKRYYAMIDSFDYLNDDSVSSILGLALEIDNSSFEFINSHILSKDVQIRLNTVKLMKLLIRGKIFQIFREQIVRALNDPVIDIVKMAIGIFNTVLTPEEFQPVLDLLKTPSRFELFDDILAAINKVNRSLGTSFYSWFMDYYRKNSEDIHIRAYLLVILIKLGNTDVYKDLIGMILSDSYIERSSSIEAFGVIAQGDKLRIIFSALQDSSPEVRLSSLKVLKNMKNRKAGQHIFNNIKYIKPLLTDTDARIQRFSQEIIAENS